MEKLSSAQVSGLLKSAHTEMVKMASHVRNLQEEVEQLRLEKRASSIAREMETKDLLPGYTRDDKVQWILSQPDINMIEKMAEVSYTGGFGRLGAGEVSAEAPASAIEAYLLSGEAE